MGSLLWTLAREKITSDTMNKAKEYAEDALKWLIDDKVLTKIDVVVERYNTDGVSMIITYYRENGEKNTMRFSNLWKQISGDNNG